MIAKVPGKEHNRASAFQEGFTQRRDVIIRYGDGTEQTLPSMTAAVMHLNISASNRKKDADVRIESTRRISPVLLVADPVVGAHLAIYEACADNRFLHFLIMCILHPIL